MDRTNNMRRPILICVILGAATLAAFWPALHNGFIHFDDPDYVTENPHVLAGLSWTNTIWAFGTGHASNWHPLTWLSHMLDAQLFGLNPAGHHLTSLLFHIANSLLLFFVIKRLTGAFWRSAFVAALFALHPLHVESVAWVSERKDVLSAFFFLLTLWAYARFARETGGGSPQSTVHSPQSTVHSPQSTVHSPQSTLETEQVPGTTQPASIVNRKSQIRISALWYGLALLFFALGLMSKPMLVTLPFVLLLLDFWPLGRLQFAANAGASPVQGSRFKVQGSKFPLPLLLEKLPFFALAAASSVITFLVQQGHGAVAPKGLPLDSRAANAILSYLLYLAKFVWPTKLAIFYPHPATTHPELKDWITWEVPAAGLVIVALSVAAIRWLRSRPWLAAGWFWYLGTLVPVIGLVQVGAQAMADRYSYLPSIGISILLAWAVAELAPAFSARNLCLGLAGVLPLAACGVLTCKQAAYWRDDASVFGHALAVTENNATAHFNYGATLELNGDVDAALRHYYQALAIEPSAETYYNIGHALGAQGKWSEAAEQYTNAFNRKPDYAPAHYNLAIALERLGKVEEAIDRYREAIRLRPDSPQSHYNLGKLLADQGKFSEAEAEYSQVLKLKPDYGQAETSLGLALAAQGKYAESLPHLEKMVLVLSNSPAAHLTLANALLDSGRSAAAREHFAAALQLEPGLVDNSLREGKSLLAQGQVLPAMARFTQAMRLAPDNADAYENLGFLLAQQGKVAEALTNFNTVIRLRPDAQAYYNLALALVALGRHGEAIPGYRKALELKPDWPVALNDLAWILATHPQVELRDGTEAVRLAERACQQAGEKEPRYWGTLDAAYAEAGRLADAMATAQKTIDLAQARELKEIVQAAQQRLELYRAGKAFHQK